jgi:hypothetical protein
MTDTAAVLAQLNGKRCRSCRERFDPIYGQVKRETADTVFSPNSVRRNVDALVDGEAGTYFECYECEAKRKRRRYWLYGGLAVLVALAYAAKYFVST